MVFSALDGRRSIREIAEATQLALFDCARAARDLAAWGMVEIAPAVLMVEAATAQLERSEPKRAVVTVRTLLERGFDLPDSVLRDVAEILEQAGESKLAGECLLNRAARSSDANEQLELARHAARLDSRSIEVAAFLLDALRHQPEAEPEEILEVSHHLADALESDRREEEAIDVLTQLDEAGADHPGTAARLARLYTRTGDYERAIPELELLAEHFQDEGKRDRLIAVYEQILKLDSSRKDIHKALRSARISESQRRVRRIALVAGIVLATGLGYWLVTAQQSSRVRSGHFDKIQQALIDGDLASAGGFLAAARNELGDDSGLDALASKLERAHAKVASDAKTAKQDEQRQRLAESGRRPAARRAVGGDRDLRRAVAAARRQPDHREGGAQPTGPTPPGAGGTAADASACAPGGAGLDPIRRRPPTCDPAPAARVQRTTNAAWSPRCLRSSSTNSRRW